MAVSYLKAWSVVKMSLSHRQASAETFCQQRISCRVAKSTRSNTGCKEDHQWSPLSCEWCHQYWHY